MTKTKFFTVLPLLIVGFGLVVFSIFMTKSESFNIFIISGIGMSYICMLFILMIPDSQVAPPVRERSPLIVEEPPEREPTVEELKAELAKLRGHVDKKKRAEPQQQAAAPTEIAASFGCPKCGEQFKSEALYHKHFKKRHKDS